MRQNLTLSAIVASPEMHQQTDSRPNEPPQRTRPRLRFLLNLNGHGWGRAAEGEALGIVGGNKDALPRRPVAPFAKKSWCLTCETCAAFRTD